jgi:hypothetical protein
VDAASLPRIESATFEPAMLEQTHAIWTRTLPAGRQKLQFTSQTSGSALFFEIVTQ